MKNYNMTDREDLQRQNLEDYLQMRSAKYRLQPLEDFGWRRETSQRLAAETDATLFKEGDTDSKG